MVDIISAMQVWNLFSGGMLAIAMMEKIYRNRLINKGDYVLEQILLVKYFL